MPFNVNCPGCNHRYNLSDEFRGKAIRCKKCNAAFRLPAAQPAATATTATNAAPGTPQPKTPQQGNDPLANHVVADPGFAEIDPSRFASKEPVGDQNFAESMAAFDAPTVRSKSNGSGKESPSTGKKFVGSPSFYALIVGSVLLIICSVVAFLIPQGPWIVMACVAVFVIVANVAQIFAIHDVYSRTPDKLILYLFVPFYQLYYIFKYWDHTKNIFILQCILAVLAIVGMIVFVISGVHHEIFKEAGT